MLLGISRVHRRNFILETRLINEVLKYFGGHSNFCSYFNAFITSHI